MFFCLFNVLKCADSNQVHGLYSKCNQHFVGAPTLIRASVLKLISLWFFSGVQQTLISNLQFGFIVASSVSHLPNNRFTEGI